MKLHYQIAVDKLIKRDSSFREYFNIHFNLENKLDYARHVLFYYCWPMYDVSDKQVLETFDFVLTRHGFPKITDDNKYDTFLKIVDKYIEFEEVYEKYKDEILTEVVDVIEEIFHTGWLGPDLTNQLMQKFLAANKRLIAIRDIIIFNFTVFALFKYYYKPDHITTDELSSYLEVIGCKFKKVPNIGDATKYDFGFPVYSFLLSEDEKKEKRNKQ